MKQSDSKGNDRRKIKALLITLFLALSVLGMLVYTSLAFYQDQEQRVNQIVPGKVDIEALIDSEGGALMPGNIAKSKIVTILNVDSVNTVDAFIRVRLIPIWRNSDGTSGSGLATGDITIDLASDWMTNWFYVPNGTVPVGTPSADIPKVTGYDGVFYLRDFLAPGEMSPHLAEAVRWEASAIPPDHENKLFELEVLAEGIQTGIPATAPAGYPAQVSWPWGGVTVTGNTLSPA